MFQYFPDLGSFTHILRLIPLSQVNQNLVLAGQIRNGTGFEFRRLAIAVEAFAGVRPAPQERCASLAADTTNKSLRPTPLEQERRTARLVRKVRLKLSQRSRPRHPVPPRARRRSPAHGTLILHIDQPGTAG